MGVGVEGGGGEGRGGRCRLGDAEDRQALILTALSNSNAPRPISTSTAAAANRRTAQAKAHHVSEGLDRRCCWRLTLRDVHRHVEPLPDVRHLRLSQRLDAVAGAVRDEHGLHRVLAAAATAAAGGSAAVGTPRPERRAAAAAAAAAAFIPPAASPAAVATAALEVSVRRGARWGRRAAARAVCRGSPAGGFIPEVGWHIACHPCYVRRCVLLLMLL